MHTLLLLLTLLFVFSSHPANVSSACGASVTRGAFVTALWQDGGAVAFDAVTPFSDLPVDHHCATAVGWAWSQGLVQGVGDSRFAPDRAITREEAAVMLRRWAILLGYDAFLPDGVAACNDYADISPWADDSLYWATDAGILDWSPGGRLNPAGSLTEEEVSAALTRLADVAPSVHLSSHAQAIG